MACNLKDYYTQFEKINFQSISTNPLGVISFYYDSLNLESDYIDGQVVLIPKKKGSGIPGENIEYLAAMSLLANLSNNTHSLKTYITSTITLPSDSLLDQQIIFEKIYKSSSSLKSYADQTLLNDGLCENVEPSSKISTQYKENTYYLYLYSNFKPTE